jgi:hypothetical protein
MCYVQVHGLYGAVTLQQNGLGRETVFNVQVAGLYGVTHPVSPCHSTCADSHGFLQFRLIFSKITRRTEKIVLLPDSF